MPREHILYLKDMWESALKVQRYTAGMSFDTFSENDLVLDATLHNLEVIGEAAKNIPNEVKARYPNIDWRAMARFRDVLSHYYFGIRIETIWDIVIHEVPDLLDQLKGVLEAERGTV